MDQKGDDKNDFHAAFLSYISERCLDAVEHTRMHARTSARAHAHTITVVHTTAVTIMYNILYNNYGHILSFFLHSLPNTSTAELNKSVIIE